MKKKTLAAASLLLALLMPLGATPLAVYADEGEGTTQSETSNGSGDSEGKDNADANPEGKGNGNTDENSEGKSNGNTDENSEGKDKDKTGEGSEADALEIEERSEERR